MKKIILNTLFIGIACLCAASFISCTLVSNSVRGNKKITVKEIKISDYETISLSGSSDVIYEMKESETPFLSVEIDENLVEYLDIKTENNELIVRTKSGSSISPSRFIVKTNSKNIKAINVRGSGNLTVNGNIKTTDLKLNVTGSGNISTKAIMTNLLEAQCSGSGDLKIDTITDATKANIAVRGSGNITIKELETIDVVASAAGSGDINLVGRAQTALYEVKGSGNIAAKNLESKDVECNVSGSGNIDLSATQSLKAQVRGSGNVRYKGQPTQIEKDIKGSGSLKNIN